MKKYLYVREGQKFGYWEVVDGAESRIAQQGRAVMCRCHCGTERKVLLRSLIGGHSKSCGCGPIYESEEAMADLLITWRIIRSNTSWLGWLGFMSWALRAGYKLDAKLRRRDILAPYSPANCYWAVERISRIGIGRRRKEYECQN